MTNLFSLVQEEMAAVEQELLEMVTVPEALLSKIGGHLLHAGGKRLRPALFLLCAKRDKEQSNEAHYLATAIELIHMATLVHDDVIDVAATRRGRPTANVIFGNHASVLAGDYLFARAFSLIAEHSRSESMKLLTDAICVICEGEIFQERDLFDLNQTMEGYFTNINRKTADFIATSCKLGGIAAGYDTQSVTALHRYGYCIGIAFQITDDLLDVTATEQEVGKPTGNDLKQGILTMPTLYALNHSHNKDKLYQLIASRAVANDATKLTKALGYIRNSGAVEYSFQQAQHYLEEARQVLPECIPLSVKKVLFDITEFIGKRHF